MATRKVWEKGRWTTVTTTEEPADMPQGLRTGLQETHLPTNWVLVVYGIPSRSDSLRDRLRKILKRHGLYSIDIGGSVYMGVRKVDLDTRVNEIIEKLKRDTGMAELVHFIVGDYDEVTAAFFKDRITENVQADVRLVEESIVELEKALAGEIVLKDPKTEKERDLMSLGESRIRNAKLLLESAEAVVARFTGNAALEADADRIRLRMTQIRTWVGSVENGFKRWADVERARRKQGATA